MSVIRTIQLRHFTSFLSLRQRRHNALRLLLQIACIALLGFSVSLLHAQTPSPDLRTYENWLREAFTAAQRRDRLGLEEAAEKIVPVTKVQVTSMIEITVDNSWLNNALTGADPDFPLISNRLGALIDALALPAQTNAPDAGRRLDELLSHPPFTQAESRDSLLLHFLDYIVHLLDKLFSPLGAVDTRVNMHTLWGWLIVLIGGVLVLGIFGYWFWGLRSSLTTVAQMTYEDDPAAALSANTAFQQANDLARGGDYRSAVRYLYISSLLWLDERGHLRYDRTLTNHEYLEHLCNNIELHHSLLPIIETFDRVWYGYEALDNESFTIYRRQVEELRKLRVKVG